MKKYSQFITELPSKTVVFAFGRFNPPTVGHELLINAVKRIAGSNDYVIYVSKTQDKNKNPLPVDRKVYYMKRMFPNTNFKAASPSERTFLEAAAKLNTRYKNLIMVAGSDRVKNFKETLEKYNGVKGTHGHFKFDTIQVISSGKRDPDSDQADGMSATKMREAAKKGDFNSFKRGIPHTLTNIDARRLMNEVRKGMGLDIVKEEVKFSIDDLREKYFQGKIFHIGDIVSHLDENFEIIDRGTNYVVVVDEQGEMHRKFVQDIKLVEAKDGVKTLEASLRNPKSYDAIDQMMQTIAKETGCTPKELHNKFVEKHGCTPDEYAKDIKESRVPKDKKTGLPKKYVSGLSPSTAAARKAHWNKANKLSDSDPEAYKPAPGDARAKTKPSKYTKKYKQMYGEETENQIEYKNYKTQHFDLCPAAVDAFNDLIKKDPEDPVAVLNAIKATDTYLGIEKEAKAAGKVTPEQITDFEAAQDRAAEFLEKLGDLENHEDYMEMHLDTIMGLNEGWSKKYKDSIDCNNPKGFSQRAHCQGKKMQEEAKPLKFSNADKVKVARIIATSLGVDDAQSKSNPRELVNMGLRNVRKKPLSRNGYGILKSMLDTARLAGIDYDRKLLPTQIQNVDEAYPGYDEEKADIQVSEDADKSLAKKSDKSGIPVGILRQVYKRGVAAWNSGHRPGTTPEQWGHARVNSFIVGGKTRHTADKDLWSKAKKAKKEGVIQPTGTDAMVANESVKVDKNSTYNLAKSIMSKDDKERLLGKEKIEKFLAAYQDFEIEDPSEEGHTLDGMGKDDDQMRRRKVNYGFKEEFDIDEATVVVRGKAQMRKMLQQMVDDYIDKGNDSQLQKLAKAIGKTVKIQGNRVVFEEIEMGKPYSTSDDSGRLSSTDSGAFDAFFEEIDDMEEDDLEKMADDMADDITDDDVIDHAYDDDEFAEIDPEGEDEPEEFKEENEQITEVLSRSERIRARQRIKRTKAKRTRAKKIALKKFSGTQTINNRARRLAVKAIKQRFARGRNLKKLSVGEKERLEKRIQSMKPLITRIAKRMVPKVRKIEKSRLAHKGFTK